MPRTDYRHGRDQATGIPLKRDGTIDQRFSKDGRWAWPTGAASSSSSTPAPTVRQLTPYHAARPAVTPQNEAQRAKVVLWLIVAGAAIAAVQIVVAAIEAFVRAAIAAVEKCVIAALEFFFAAIPYLVTMFALVIFCCIVKLLVLEVLPVVWPHLVWSLQTGRDYALQFVGWCWQKGERFAVQRSALCRAFRNDSLWGITGNDLLFEMLLFVLMAFAVHWGSQKYAGYCCALVSGSAVHWPLLCIVTGPKCEAAVLTHRGSTDFLEVSLAVMVWASFLYLRKLEWRHVFASAASHFNASSGISSYVKDNFKPAELFRDKGSSGASEAQSVFQSTKGPLSTNPPSEEVISHVIENILEPARQEAARQDERQTCDVCFDKSPEGVGCTGPSSHFMCSKCVEHHVQTILQDLIPGPAASEQRLERHRAQGGRIKCVQPECEAFYSDTALARALPDAVFGQYRAAQDEVVEQRVFEQLQQRFDKQLADAKAEFQRSSRAAQNAHDKAATAEFMRRRYPNAVQCPRCHAGPVIPENCFDLEAHHGESTRGGRISNACPSCGFFSRDRGEWVRWNGRMR